jgi:flagellar protein FlgJ
MTLAVNSAQSAGTPAYQQEVSKLKKAAQGFEAIFLNTLLKDMRKSTKQSNPLFGGGFAAGEYQDMMDQQLATTMSKSGGFGLATMLVKNLSPLLPGAPTKPVSTPTAGTTAAGTAVAGTEAAAAALAGSVNSGAGQTSELSAVAPLAVVPAGVPTRGAR